MPSLNFVHIIDSDKLDNFKPINDNVLVEVFDNRAFMNGVNIHITNDNVFIPQFGKVVALDNSNELNIGDQVIFEKYKGERCSSIDNKRTFLLLKSSMILATIDGIDVSKL